MKENIPTRKNIRLKEYDYSERGYYFITICTKNRECILSKIEIQNVGSDISLPIILELTKEGKIVEKYIQQIEKIYSNILIDEYVIMPNHIHMILIINNQKNNTISKIVQQLKGIITKEIGNSIWQKLFYERIIRNEQEYLMIKEYIQNNPLNWENDRYF